MRSGFLDGVGGSRPRKAVYPANEIAACRTLPRPEPAKDLFEDIVHGLAQQPATPATAILAF